METRFANLVELVDRSCDSFAARPLFGTKRDERWSWTTYEAFRELVLRCRGALASLGVRAGDKVAIISNNRVEWAAVAFATYSSGAIIVPMYEAQRPSEREFILADCGAKVVFVAGRAIAAPLSDARPRLTALEHVIEFDGPRGAASSFEALLERGGSTPGPTLVVPEDATAALLYTSGTTGSPKGVMLSHRNLVSNVNALQVVFLFEPED